MTSTIDPAGRTRRRPQGGGFTLIELLVVIGIIVLLIGILLPALNLARKSAATARTRADLNAIVTALEAYKSDFGFYPPVAGIDPNTGNQLVGTGAHVLCQALFGLGPAYPTYNGTQVTENGNDGNDGPGFRTHRTIDGGDPNPPTTTHPPYPPSAFPRVAGAQTADDGIPDSFGGKVYGPYLNPEAFRFDTSQGFDKVCILDRSNTPYPHADQLGDSGLTGAPILYYPANTVTGNLTAVANATQGVPLIAEAAPYAGGNTTSNATYTSFIGSNPVHPLPIFNVNDNIQDLDSTAPSTVKPQVSAILLRAMLGNYDLSGTIASGETFNGKQPFLLWARGGDALWGPKGANGQAATDTELTANPHLVDKADDVTNFR